jgi:hypothetical protein
VLHRVRPHSAAKYVCFATYGSDAKYSLPNCASRGSVKTLTCKSRLILGLTNINGL